MRYMVSYQYHNGQCGNQSCDTPAEARQYIADNKHNWKSHSTFTFQSGLPLADLTPIEL